MSILDVFVTCHRILRYVDKMRVDEEKIYALSNYKLGKTNGKITESDHNAVILDLNLKFCKVKPERIELFNFKDKTAQAIFKSITTSTTSFTDAFQMN